MKPQEALEFKIPIDLSMQGIEEAMIKMADHRPPHIGWYVIIVPSQNISEALLLSKEFNDLPNLLGINGRMYVELSLQYAPDEWSLTHYWVTDKVQYLTVWSKGA